MRSSCARWAKKKNFVLPSDKRTYILFVEKHKKNAKKEKIRLVFKKVIHIFRAFCQIYQQFDKKRTFVFGRVQNRFPHFNFFCGNLFLCKNRLTKNTEEVIISFVMSSPQRAKRRSAPLAKLDIASVYGTEGQEFESLTVHQKSIIRIVYLLQVSGSDLLFISAIISLKGL